MAAQETTTPQPKERIIFDADSYYGTEGENMAVEDIMERYGITEEEVREQYSDEEIFDRAMEMRETDYEEETDALIGWFDGQTPRLHARDHRREQRLVREPRHRVRQHRTVGRHPQRVHRIRQL